MKNTLKYNHNHTSKQATYIQSAVEIKAFNIFSKPKSEITPFFEK
jgi:hypothetical protein